MLGLGLGLNKSNVIQKSLIKDGLVLYLDGKDFKNSPPTTLWMDRSGLGNNATPSGINYTPTSGSDGVGGVVFDGVDDSFALPITLNGNYTFEWYINPIINGWLFDSLLGRFVVALNSPSTLNNLGFNDGAWKNFGVACPFNQLNHIVITFNSDTLTATLTLNKVKYASISYTPTNIGGSTRLLSENASINSFLKSSLKLFRLYNRALTDAEILQNYNTLK